ncbi:MAG: MopE-related protein [Myxococcales bacterium]|nr:MopE-related protein [Myxococcales bacterium]
MTTVHERSGRAGLWLFLGATLVSALGGCGRTRPNDPLRQDADAAAALCAQRCDDGVFCNGPEQCDPESGECLPGEPESCDDGDECTLDRCDLQLDQCVAARLPRDEDRDGWDACAGDCDDQDPEVHPGATEVCDMVDQDCDGQIDEKLRSECGDCRPGCRLLYLPEPGELWDPRADNSDAVERQGADGPLILSGENQQRFDAWIANYVDGKVTKIDTRSGAQLARYDSVLLGDDNHAEPPDALCDREGFTENDGGNCPSRTAVDFQGAVYVANRAFGRHGTVTKIAGFPDDCVDKNGDGRIQTSSDQNGNGEIERHVDGEFLGQDDECLLWTVDVGGDNSVPRALAVAPDGGVWVGLNESARVVELDPADGSERRSISLGGFRPYGAALDTQGRVWLTEALTGQIVSIDTESGQASSARSAPSPEAGCPSSYGIAVDSEDRVWIAGFTCPYAFGYDPATKEWTTVALPDGGVTRGIAADDRGRIFVAASHSWLIIDASSVFNFIESSDPITRLSVFDADGGGNLRTFGLSDDPLPGRGAIGVGLDSEGRAWLVNKDSSSATRVDVDSGEVSHFGAGDLPYTYSDFTGFALRRIVAPTGFIREVLEGCERGPSEWEHVWIDAKGQNSARVELRLRAASSLEELGAAMWHGPFEGAEVDLLKLPQPPPNERFLEVEGRLVSGDGRASPALTQVKVQLHCPL